MKEVRVNGGYVDIGPGKMARRGPMLLAPALKEPMDANPIWVKLKAFCRGSSGTIPEQKVQEPENLSWEIE